VCRVCCLSVRAGGLKGSRIFRACGDGLVVNTIEEN
jgi:hypothetical protein